MLQHNVIGSTEQTFEREVEKDSLTIAKEKWHQRRMANARNMMNKKKNQRINQERHLEETQAIEAPLLTQPQVDESEHLKGCIKQRIARMEKMLNDQVSRTTENRQADRLNELLSPAMRSVIRGRERMLRCLQESAAV